MERLADILQKDGARQRLVREMAEVVEQEVQSRSGLTGAAVRSGYRLVTSLRRNFVRDALDDMLEAFLFELDALYTEHGSPQGFGDYLVENKALVASRMLKVTRDRRRAIRTASLRQAYDKLEPFALPNVEAAIPRLGQIIQRFVDEMNPVRKYAVV